MKLDLNRSTETSRFVLALMLSTATALLVAAPFLIVMLRSTSEPTVEPGAPETSTDDTRPLPSLGIDESEVGRIGETEPKKASPRPSAPASPTQEQPAPPEPEQTVTTPAPSTTVVAPSTTVVDPTTTVADSSSQTSIN